MSRHEDLPRLRHMLDHAKDAAEMAQGITRSAFDTDRKLNLSLVRLLEIVGEAAARVSIGTRERYPDIPWQEIVSLRNRLIHGYDQVDFDILKSRSWHRSSSRNGSLSFQMRTEPGSQNFRGLSALDTCRRDGTGGLIPQGRDRLMF